MARKCQVETFGDIKIEFSNNGTEIGTVWFGSPESELHVYDGSGRYLRTESQGELATAKTDQQKVAYALMDAMNENILADEKIPEGKRGILQIFASRII